MFSNVSKSNIKGKEPLNIKNLSWLVGGINEVAGKYKTIRLVIGVQCVKLIVTKNLKFG